MPLPLPFHPSESAIGGWPVSSECHRTVLKSLLDPTTVGRRGCYPIGEFSWSGSMQ